MAQPSTQIRTSSPSVLSNRVITSYAQLHTLTFKLIDEVKKNLIQLLRHTSYICLWLHIGWHALEGLGGHRGLHVTPMGGPSVSCFASTDNIALSSPPGQDRGPGQKWSSSRHWARPIRQIALPSDMAKGSCGGLGAHARLREK